MSVTVPSSDVPNFNLQGNITNLTALITAAGSNGPLAFRLTKDKSNAQLELVMGLLGSGSLLASSILSTLTYLVPTQPGGDQN